MGNVLPLGIDYFRERLLSCLLLVLAIFASLAYLPSVYYGFVYRFHSIILIDTFVLASLFYLTGSKKFSFTAKTMGLLTLFYILGVWLLVVLGPTGAGFMWMLLFSIMAGVLLGFRPAVVTLGINVLTFLMLSVLVYTQTISWKLLPADALAIWTVKGVNFLCINAIVSISTGFLITKISWMANEEKQRREALAREMKARLAAEKETKELTLRLYQSQKMEAMGTLAGGVAHDFNNILSTILGYTELSLMSRDLPKPVRINLNHIIRASERAKGISHQILTFSRQTAARKDACDLGEIAAECMALFKITVPPGIALRQDVPDRPFPMVADKAQISQVVMNLLTNSRQALEETEEQKGDICLSVEWADNARSNPSPDMPVLALRVSDTGRGIEAEQLARLFEPYFTTKGVGVGSGMGLAISHGIVKEHGGDILVQSRSGEGSTFTVLLPAQNSPDQAAKPVEIQGTGGTEHILIVDDEQDILSIDQQILSGLGYRITACTSPVEAAEIIQADPGDIDLVITDRKMKGMTGIELRRTISGLAPELPVILCTGFPDPEDTRLFKAVLVKPVAGSELAVTVRQILDGTAAD